MGLNQFCLSAGEAIRQERRAARSRTTGKRLDAAGARRPQTHPNRLDRFGRFKLPGAASRDRWAGPVWPKSGDLRLGRIPIRPSPKPLALNQTCSGRMVQSHDKPL